MLLGNKGKKQEKSGALADGKLSHRERKTRNIFLEKNICVIGCI